MWKHKRTVATVSELILSVAVALAMILGFFHCAEKLCR